MARAAPRRIGHADDLALDEWLGVELEPHRTYVLRTEVDGAAQDVCIMVSELMSIDIMLEPPTPSGMVDACAATERGALATRVPAPGPALDRAAAE